MGLRNVVVELGIINYIDDNDDGKGLMRMRGWDCIGSVRKRG